MAVDGEVQRVSSEAPAPARRPLRPEILAPAGDLRSLRAALAAGADAVYFGLSDGFNARAKAESFTRAGLPAVVAEVHRAGARAYLTLNVLVFETELAAVEAILRDVAAAGVDALIVQDPAVALLARAVCPALEIHASTQMTISSAEGIRFAEGLGATRIVLPRELSLKEIERLRRDSAAELEVFVHGALCVSWSGQCLTSEAWGGRSANRGQCAQSCRMPYDLVVDGAVRDLGDVRYLLSPRDLAGFRALDGLRSLGVHTLKIEGRYKGPAYVVAAVQAYRRWLDALERPGGPTAEDEAALTEDLNALTLVYSRGFSDGFFAGADHQHLVEGRFPKHRGVLLGQVEAVEGRAVRVGPAPEGRPRTGGLALGAERTGPVGRREVALPVLGGDADASTGAGAGPPQPRAGMGVVFDQGHPESQEAGGPLFAVEPVSTSGGAAGPADAAATRWWLRFGEPGPDLRRVAVGDRVWLTGDPGIERRVRKLLEQPVTGRLPIQLRVRGAAGAPLTVEAVGRRLRAEGQSTAPLTPAAAGGGLTEALLLDKLGAFGGTAFTLLDLDASGLEAGLHLPVSQLKALRRDLVAALDAQQAAGVDRAIDPRPALPRLHAQAAAVLAARAAAAAAPTGGAPVAAAAAASDPLDRRPPELLPLCRTEAQLDAVIAAGLPLVELDWMERAGLTLAVARARAAGLRVHIATPRVQKPGEEGFDKRIARLSPDGILVRHWGALMHFLEHPEDQRPALHGDFSLNVTNALTAAHLLSLGLDTLTAAHDLDAAQLLALLATVPGAAGTLTVALHHHIPTFHTEHCVYAHLLSNGRDISSCGQPCQNHEIGLRDHLGNVHPVVVDPACRNTVYNAAAQSAASLVPQLRAAGVRRFRVEFVREGVEETARVLAAYQGLLAGHLSPSQVFERLRVHEQFGVSRGTMRVER